VAGQHVGRDPLGQCLDQRHVGPLLDDGLRPAKHHAVVHGPPEVVGRPGGREVQLEDHVHLEWLGL